MATDIFNLINSNSSINDIITLVKNDKNIIKTINSDGQTPIMLSLSKNMQELSIQLFPYYENSLDVVDKFGNTAFIYACKNSMTTLISSFIKKLNDININQVNNEGDNALIICCRNKLESVCIDILNIAKDIIKIDTISNVDKNTAFMIAIKNSMIQTINKLLTFNKDKLLMDNVNLDGLTAKQLAINNGLNDLVNTLEGLDTDVFTLINNNDLDVFKKIVSINKSLLDTKNSLSQLPISFAIINSKNEFINYLLQQEIKLNETDDFGFTPLMYCCMFKNDAYNTILDIGKNKGGDFINISYTNKNNDSAFTWACENNLSDIALRILEFKNIEVNFDILVLACKKGLNRVILKILDRSEIDLSKTDKFGNTILQLCCVYKINDVAIKLLENNSKSINLSNVSNSGYTAFMLACEYRLEDVANKILTFNPEEINISHINNDGNTSLMLACKNKLNDVAIKILDIDTDTIRLSNTNNDGNTAFIFACMYKLENIALAMLDNGPDAVRLDQINNNNKSAYIIAKNNKLEKLIATIKIFSTNIFSILENNESVDSFVSYIENKPETLQLLNKDGNTILVESIKKNRPDITIKILEFDTDIKYKKYNFVDEYGFTPLMLACLYSTEDIVLKFLENKPKDILIDYVNTNGDTALIIACAKGLSNATLKMMDLNPIDIRLSHVNDTGNTALLIACRYKLEETALKIIENQSYAKINKANKANDTALIWACRNSLKNVINKLLDLNDPKLIKLNNIGFNNETAFILACSNKLDDIAIKMLDFGIESLSFDTLNSEGMDAKTISKNNNLVNVNTKIKELTRNNIFYLMKQNRSSADITQLVDSNIQVLKQLNSNKQTPLMVSIFTKKQYIPLIFTKYGYEANMLETVDIANRTALLYACRYANENVALQLINMDVQMNTIGIADNDGFTPLIWACKNKMIKTIQKILSLPIDKINLGQTAFNNSALIEACISGLTDIVSTILTFKPSEYNISIFFKEYNRIIDNNGNTIMDILRKNKLDNLIALITPFIPSSISINKDIPEINDDTMIIEPTLKYSGEIDYDDIMVNAKEFLESIGGSIIIQYNTFLYGTTIYSFKNTKYIMFPCNTIINNATINNVFKNLELYDITKSSSIPIDGMVNFKSIKPILNKSDDTDRIFRLVNTNKKYISPINNIDFESHDKQTPTCNIDGGFIYNLIPVKELSNKFGVSITDLGITTNIEQIPTTSQISTNTISNNIPSKISTIEPSLEIVNENIDKSKPIENNIEEKEESNEVSIEETVPIESNTREVMEETSEENIDENNTTVNINDESTPKIIDENIEDSESSESNTEVEKEQTNEEVNEESIPIENNEEETKETSEENIGENNTTVINNDETTPNTIDETIGNNTSEETTSNNSETTTNESSMKDTESLQTNSSQNLNEIKKGGNIINYKNIFYRKRK